MDFFEFFYFLFELSFNFVFSAYFIIIIALVIIIYHVLLFIFRDIRFLNEVRKFSDPKSLSISDLKETPLINIIIPAWKEYEPFKNCLLYLKQLTYPKLKIYVNAGGADKTINIANSFREDKRFSVLYQKKGEGKVKAINDCIEHVSEGIILLMDADLLIDDSGLLKIIYPIVNENENLVVALLKPAKSIKEKALVKYEYLNRNIFFINKFSRYVKFVGPITSIKYEVFNAIKKFSPKRMSDDGTSMGQDISAKGFKTYHLIDLKIESTTYPMKFIDYLHQNSRWIENSLFHSISYKTNKIFKFSLLVFLSLYILTCPILLFFNVYFFFYGILFMFSMYLKKVRKFLFLKFAKKDDSLRFQFSFFIKLIFFIYFDLIVNIIVFLEMVFYRKAYKKRKNLV